MHRSDASDPTGSSTTRQTKKVNTLNVKILSNSVLNLHSSVSSSIISNDFASIPRKKMNNIADRVHRRVFALLVFLISSYFLRKTNFSSLVQKNLRNAMHLFIGFCLTAELQSLKKYYYCHFQSFNEDVLCPLVFSLSYMPLSNNKLPYPIYFCSRIP